MPSVAISRPTSFHRTHTLLRLDGQYGTGAVLADLAGFAFVTRGKEYTVLDHPLVQARLHLPPDQVQQRPESQTVRSLYDCPQVPMGSEGTSCHPITERAGRHLSDLHPLQHLDMVHPPRPRPGKRVASLDKIFRSSPMGPCAVQQAARSRSRSGGKKLRGACGWCMPPAFAVVVPVSCVSSANGMGAPPKSRARSVCSCIRSASGVSRFSGRTGVAECIGAHASTSSVLNASRCKGTLLALCCHFSRHFLHSLSRAERAHTRLAWKSRLARNARPEPAGQVTIRLFGIPEGFCHLARDGSGFILLCRGGGFLSLEQACFSLLPATCACLPLS